MVLEVRTIELRIVNAVKLKKVSKFKQQRCYVLAYIYPAQRQATLVDTTGGVNPTWDASVSLNCYETDLHPEGSSRFRRAPPTPSSSSRAITIDIYSHSGGFFTRGNKMVGTVKVPLHQIASVVQMAELSLMSCDVRRPSGRIQGKLNLIVQLGEKRAITETQQRPPSYAYYDKVETSFMSRMATKCTSGSGSTNGVFDPSLNTFGKKGVQPSPNLNTFGNRGVQPSPNSNTSGKRGVQPSPNLNTSGKRGVQPSSNYGWFLSALAPTKQQEAGRARAHDKVHTPASPRPQKKPGGQRATRVGGKKRKSLAAKAVLVVGGIIMAAILL